jgi:hypothetical protein
VLPNDAAEFRILGPLEVLVGRPLLELSGTRRQIVLLRMTSVQHRR